MGTNFYAKHIVTESEYNQLQEDLKKKDYATLKEHLEEYDAEYHIGKRSCGWAFGFQACSDDIWDVQVPWEANLESLKEYLKRDDVEIHDEYGQKFTSDEFWEEIKDSIYIDDNHIWIDEYYKQYPDMKLGDTYEFLVDNTRWTKCTFC